MIVAAAPRELERDFESFGEWQDWRGLHDEFFLPNYREGIAAHVLKFGFREPITGQLVDPSLIERGPNLREGLAYRGIVTRQRAVMRIIEQTVYMSEAFSVRIYAPEALTPLALRLRSVFPKFVGSEFTTDPALHREMYPIQCEDLTSLTLPSDTFDLVTTNEVLEHVPNIDAALREIARVLKPGCWHIGTHPLLDQEDSIIKASLDSGKIVYLMKPEYHGDPFGKTGSLVFELPGWNILARARRAGFAKAVMRFFVSQYHGCVSETTGIFVLCCRK